VTWTPLTFLHIAKEEIMRSIIVLMCAMMIFSSVAACAEGMFSIRPYGRIGYLLAGVNAEELGYTSVEGDNLDEYLDIDKLNYGLGAQFLLSFSPESPIKFGVDLGIQNLFKATFDTGSADLDFIDVDNDVETEWSAYMLGVVEFSPPGMPVFLQGGAGIHLAYWQWEQNYESDYTVDYDTDSGTEVNLAIMLAVGVNIIDTGKIAVPIMVRADNIFRYDWLTYIGATVGVTIKL